MYNFDFLKQPREFKTNPDCFEITWKMSLTVVTFHSSVTSSSESKLDLKIGKIFSKTHLFQVFHPHKNEPVALAHWHVFDYVNFNICAVFHVPYVSFNICAVFYGQHKSI